MKTSSWFQKLPPDHIKIGISRGVPRRIEAGYRLFKKLSPGPWFNSVGALEYDRLYKAEILAPLDVKATVETIIELARGKEPVLVCYEMPGRGEWCHRAMTALWISNALGVPVPEFGYEHLPQDQHPLMPKELRRQPVPEAGDDITPFIGKEAAINGIPHRVVGADPRNPGQAIVEPREGARFSATLTALRQHFS